MHRKYWVLLLFMALLLLFAGNDSLLITDNVEANYALTAKEMVLSNDWLSPQIYGHYWFDKPIFFYWLTALGFKIFGFTEFGARFFPALLGLGGLALAAYGGKRLYNERTGWLSGFVLLTSLEFFLISKSIITDAALFLFFSATLLFFYLGYRDGLARDWYLMYASSALAVLTKGPIGVLLPGLVIIIFLLWKQDWQIIKRCKLFTGLSLFLLLAMPWYIAMYQLHGENFINMFFGVHNYLRATVSEHPRDNVIYYYTLVNLLALFPWSFLLPWVLWKKHREGKWHLADRELFLIIWSVTIFVFFQCMATKYITYTYPLLFPMAIVIAHLLDKYGDNGCNNIYRTCIGGFFALVLTAAWILGNKEVLELRELYLLPLSLIVGTICYRLLDLAGHNKMVGIGILCWCFYLALIYSVAISLTEKRSAKDLGILLQQDEAKIVCTYGSYPTSAVFYSDKLLYRLVNKNSVHSYLPRKMSWSSKNVMPYKILESKEYNQVVVKNKYFNEFKRQNKEQWSVVGSVQDWMLLEKKKC